MDGIPLGVARYARLTPLQADSTATDRRVAGSSVSSVSWGSVLQVVLLVLAVGLWSHHHRPRPPRLVTGIRRRVRCLLVIGFLLAQTPRLPRRCPPLGAAPRPFATWPVYLLQLAQGYVGSPCHRARPASP